MKGFIPLREDAEKKGKMIKAASDRHAPPDEACKIIGNYSAAEVKMIKYVETNSTQMRNPAAGRRPVEGRPQEHRRLLRRRSAPLAEQMKTRGPAGPSLSEVLGSATSAPEATASRKGGSTFDTLNGNVLSR